MCEPRALTYMIKTGWYRFDVVGNARFTIAFASGVGCRAYSQACVRPGFGDRAPLSGCGGGEGEVAPNNKFATAWRKRLQRYHCSEYALVNRPFINPIKQKIGTNYLDEILDAVRQTAVFVQVIPASQRLPGGEHVDSDREAKAGLARARLSAETKRVELAKEPILLTLVLEGMFVGGWVGEGDVRYCFDWLSWPVAINRGIHSPTIMRPNTKLKRNRNDHHQMPTSGTVENTAVKTPTSTNTPPRHLQQL